MKKRRSLKKIAWFSALERSDKEAIDYLVMEIRSKIINHLCSQGANRAEAEDIFMDVVEAIFRKIRKLQQPFFDDDKFEAYFTKACQWQWYNKYRQKKSNIQVTNEEFDLLSNRHSIEKELLEVERSQFVWRAFQQLGSICQKILSLFLIEKESHQEIAQQMGYSYQYAKKKKYRCFLRLVEIVQSTPLYNELIDK